MLTPDQLKQVVHVDGRSRRDAALLILAVDRKSPKNLAAIRTLGKSAGVRQIEKWNLSDILAKSQNLAIKTDTGWELSPGGAEYIQLMLQATDLNIVVANASQSLRAHLVKLTDAESIAFIEEAIVCFEARQYRAAVVFSWVGAVSVLKQHVFTNKLAEFNKEASRRDGKWRVAKTADDIGRMKEHDFLDVLEAIGVVGKNVKMTLQNHCLQLRNSCGHPNSLKIAENSVSAHIEKLVLNVFAVF